ncbi:MAG: response regulator [Patescibacteria group bacterium UBA2103]
MEDQVKKYKIYLVDDDRFLLDMYSMKFKSAGMDVTACQGGNFVLEELRKGTPPDAILLDIVMPEVDGFAVLEAINRENLAPKTKIIILSNQGQDTDIERAKELGAAGYIIKASAIPSEVLERTTKILSGESE